MAYNDNVMKILDVAKEHIEMYEKRSRSGEWITYGYDPTVKQLYEIIQELLRTRPDWPKEMHEQYLRTLDERDELQRKLDER